MPTEHVSDRATDHKLQSHAESSRKQHSEGYPGGSVDQIFRCNFRVFEAVRLHTPNQLLLSVDQDRDRGIDNHSTDQHKDHHKNSRQFF